jgi:hypothetical protein
MKFVKTFKYIFCFIFIPFLQHAQTGGYNSFTLLDIPFSARSVALGTDFITVKDKDLSLVVNNPSLLNEKMNKTISISQSLLAVSINTGMFNYAFKTKFGLFAPSVRYVSYGTFTRTNEYGIDEGKFHPFEAIIGSAYSRQLNPRISVGANLNLLFSQLETYNSWGMSFDLAGTYQSKDSLFTATALVKNIGYQFKNYNGKEKDPLPTDFQLGVSYKIKHAPFRFSILAHHLNKWDLTYRDPNLKETKDPLTGEVIPVKYASWGEKLARHFTYQIEIVFPKALQIYFAFDYHRRQEMKMASRPGLSGFSTGINLNFKKFTITYGFAYYARSGMQNMLSLSSNISSWRK